MIFGLKHQNIKLVSSWTDFAFFCFDLFFFQLSSLFPQFCFVLFFSATIHHHFSSWHSAPHWPALGEAENKPLYRVTHRKSFSGPFWYHYTRRSRANNLSIYGAKIVINPPSCFLQAWDEEMRSFKSHIDGFAFGWAPLAGAWIAVSETRSSILVFSYIFIHYIFYIFYVIIIIVIIIQDKKPRQSFR